MKAKKTFLISKITILLLLFLFLFYNTTFAKEGVRITPYEAVDNTSTNIQTVAIDLIKALKNISDRFNACFTFELDLIRDIKVDDSFKNFDNLENTLKHVLKGTDLEYKILESHYVIICKNKQFNNKKLLLDTLIGSIDLQKNIPNTILAETVELSNLLPQEQSPDVVAQNRLEVKGRVLDQRAEPLPGANIQIKGTNIGTTADVNGNFILKNVDPKAVLVISFIGFKTLETKADEKETTITMIEDSQLLDEAVVIGYGTTQRSDLTGSISSVSESVLESSTFSDVAHAIQGQLAGVNILVGDGSPGEPVQVSIRGFGSLLGNTEPLIILDGMPMPSEFNLNDLNPSDVKSIDILKGASSAAIYGSRAASGVILIETKYGKLNEKPTINYSFTYGFERIISQIDVLNAQEWKYLMFEGVKNAAIYNALESVETYAPYKNMLAPGYFGEYDTNWYNEMMQPGGTATHNLSIRGGSNNTTYTASLGYTDDKGIMKETGFTRYNLNLGLNSKISNNLLFNLSVRGNVSDRDAATANLYEAVRGRPDMRAYNDDGSPAVNIYYMANGDPRLLNSPLTLLLDNINNNFSKNVGASGYLQYNILRNLNVKTRVNYNIADSRTKRYYASTTVAGAGAAFIKSGSLTDTRMETTQFEWENSINYNLRYKKHTLDLVGVTAYLAESRRSASISFDDFPDDKIQNEFYQGATYVGSNGYINDAYMFSLIGRANYKYLNRYLLTLSFRRDGSSKFSQENAYGNFPSVAGAWIISNEPFMKKYHWINQLKLRASMGLTGMADVGYYRWRTTYEATNYNGKPAVIPNQAGNNELRWERSLQHDIAMEFQLFNSRVKGSVAYYSKNTDGLLYPYTMAPSTGFTNAIVNFAKIKNSGFDIELNLDLIRKNNFYWTMGLNWNNNKNIVKQLDKDYITSTAGTQALTRSIIKEGYPLGLLYGFKTDGIYTSWEQIEADNALNPDQKYQREMFPGEIRFVDLNGDGWVDQSVATAINNPDRTVIGYSLPDFSGGINSRIMYKQWELNITGTYSFGNDKVWYNETWSFATTEANPGNVWRIALQRWTPDSTDPDPKYPSFRIGRNVLAREFNDYSVYDASFFKIQNLQLAYSVPMKKIDKFKMLDNLQIFASIRNVYTFTKYPGPNPEGFARDDRIEGALLDYSQYPKSRNFNFGIKLTLK